MFGLAGCYFTTERIWSSSTLVFFSGFLLTSGSLILKIYCTTPYVFAFFLFILIDWYFFFKMDDWHPSPISTPLWTLILKVALNSYQIMYMAMKLLVSQLLLSLWKWGTASKNGCNSWNVTVKPFELKLTLHILTLEGLTCQIIWY